MIYTVQNIGERVYALLDENREIMTERMEYCDPGASPDALVSMLLPEAVRDTLLSVPLPMIDEVRHVFSGTPDFRSRQCAVYRLPAGFLRLVWLRMSDWTHGIDTTLAAGGEEYCLRLRGRGSRRRSRPAAAVRRRGDVSELEIFGTESGSTVAELDYVCLPEVRDGAVDLPPGVFHEVCRRLAGMIKEIIYR